MIRNLDWWNSLPEDARVNLLQEADRGHFGAQEAIVDVEEAMQALEGEGAVAAFDAWIAKVRS